MSELLPAIEHETAASPRYKVTGSWDKPDIVKIGSRRVPKPEEAKAKPAGQ